MSSEFSKDSGKIIRISLYEDTLKECGHNRKINHNTSREKHSWSTLNITDNQISEVNPSLKDSLSAISGI